MNKTQGMDHEELQRWRIWVAALHETWSVERGYHDSLCLSVPSGGSVTVSFFMRDYELGYNPVRTRGSYKGRGWKESLMTSAIRALDSCADALI
jgi:hypothetical protein